MIKIMASIKASPSAFFLMGIINLLIGLTIISFYNNWSHINLAFLVTLLGWVMFLRGLVVFFFPKILFMKNVTSKNFKLWGLIPLVWGLALCWLAFNY